jgi:hypothetical protein
VVLLKIPVFRISCCGSVCVVREVSQNLNAFILSVLLLDCLTVRIWHPNTWIFENHICTVLSLSSTTQCVTTQITTTQTSITMKLLCMQIKAYWNIYWQSIKLTSIKTGLYHLPCKIILTSTVPHYYSFMTVLLFCFVSLFHLFVCHLFWQVSCPTVFTTEPVDLQMIWYVCMYICSCWHITNVALQVPSVWGNNSLN